MSRNLDAILDEARKLIDPPPDRVEAFRARLTILIDTARRIHQSAASVPPPGEMKAGAGAYLKVLHAAREAGDAVSSFHTRTDAFLAELDAEINRVDALTYLVVPPGSPQRNVVADTAVIMARDLIDPDPYRHPENRSLYGPFVECPWRRRATLTVGGLWLKLAALIYEGATGEVASNSMMMKHCREADKQQPRYLAKGLRFQA
jgi:hypothetical protein